MKEFKTFTSISVNDLDAAKSFYTKMLGLNLNVHEEHNLFFASTGGDTRFMIYAKEDHKPADFTVLNFEVDNIETVVDELTQKGVSFEQIEDANEKGIAERGPTKAAWTKDPAGNWIGIFQEE